MDAQYKMKHAAIEEAGPHELPYKILTVKTCVTLFTALAALVCRIAVLATVHANLYPWQSIAAWFKTVHICIDKHKLANATQG